MKRRRTIQISGTEIQPSAIYAGLFLFLQTICLAEDAAIWVKPPGKAALRDTPGLRHEVFESTIMKTRIGYNVVLPPGYDAEPEKRYPVIYWLHGGGGNESSTLFTAKTWLELQESGDIEKLILVYPNGYRSGYMDHADGKVMIESVMIQELIPRIDRTLRTIARREGRAVHGFSMGASGALKFAIKYPDLFCAAIAGGGGAIDLEKTTSQFVLNILERNFGSDPELIRRNNTYRILEQNYGQLHKNGTQFLLLCGDADPWLESAETFQKALQKNDISCELVKVPGVKHNLRAVFEAEGKRSAIFQDKVFRKSSSTPELRFLRN